MTPLILTLCGVVEPALPMNISSYPPFRKITLQLASYFNCSYSRTFHYKCFSWALFKAAIFFLNYPAWVAMLKSLMLMANQFVVGSISLSLSLSVFEKNIRNMKCSQFILSHCRNNEDDPFQCAILIYRKIQIIAKVFNEIHASALVTYLCCAMLTQIIPATQLISGPKVSPQQYDPVVFWTKQFLIVALFNGFASMALYFFVADVHFRSNHCFKTLRNWKILRIASNRKVLMSLPIVKIEFGGSNYIEKITPVVFQHFTTLRIIDVLLLSRRNH